MRKILFLILVLFVLGGCREQEKTNPRYRYTYVDDLRVGKQMPKDATFYGQTPEYTTYKVCRNNGSSIFMTCFLITVRNDTICTIQRID